jgi:endonuclease/exonuclease/phosphatase family metal-dependent hydrolase
MRRASVVCIALLACAPPEQFPGPPARSRAPFLRVVTWNVHDLFDETDRQTPPGDQDRVFTHAEVETKLARLGSVLARIDPDVVVLEEVENVALLDRLAAGPLADRGYRAFLREGHDPRGIDVGLLSRVAFEAGPTHLDERAPDGRMLWSRDVLEIHLPWGAREIVLLAAHLVSRLDPGDDGRRRLQAARLRQIADALRSGEEHPPTVLVVGDLNDLPTSAPLAPLLADQLLVDLGGGLAPAEAWTWSGGGSRERIDYALLPRSDRSLAVWVEVAGGADVEAVSDHRPLLVDLWLAGLED